MSGALVRVVRAVRSEITKILTLRSHLIAIALTVVLAAVFGYLTGLTSRNVLDANDPTLDANFTPQLSGLVALVYGQIGIIVLGVLVAGSEYAGGQIRVSLAAVPNRNLFLAAKAAALTLVSLAVAVATVVSSGLAAEAGLGAHGDMSWAAGNLLTGAVCYLVLMSALGFALTMVTRNAVIPLALLITLTQAGSNLLLQTSSIGDLAKYLPDMAGMVMFFPDSPSHDILTATTGGLVMAAWVAVLLLVSQLLLNRRDA